MGEVCFDLVREGSHVAVLRSALLSPEEIRQSAEACEAHGNPRFADRDG